MNSNINTEEYFFHAKNHLLKQNAVCWDNNRNIRYKFSSNGVVLASPFGNVLPYEFYSEELESVELYKILMPQYKLDKFIPYLRDIRYYFSNVDPIIAKRIEEIHNLGMRSLWHYKLSQLRLWVRQ